MTEKIVVPIVTALGTGLVILCGIGISKVKKLTDTIGKSIDGVSRMTERDISNALVELAIEKAANKCVAEEVAIARDRVQAKANEDIHAAVTDAVAKAKDEIYDKVAVKVQEKVEQIDIEDLKRRVRQRAEEHVVAKFDGSLNDLLDKFSTNLGHVQSIYSSISDTLKHGSGDDNSKKITFSL